MSTQIRKIDEPTYKELIKILRKVGIDFSQLNDTTQFIIEPNNTNQFLPIDRVIRLVVAEGNPISVIREETGNDAYQRQNVKPASYEELDQLKGILSKEEADELRAEIQRSREDDWD